MLSCEMCKACPWVSKEVYKSKATKETHELT